jgi:hypothetical protein
LNVLAYELSNADLRACLEGSRRLRNFADDLKMQIANVGRILSRFHAHRLVVKISRSHRWRVTDRGKQIMAASLRLREVAFPELFRKNAA